MTSVRIRRIYQEPEPDDGARVLVDRLWPRGTGRGALRLDLWAKQVAPSTELRRWYAHQAERFPDFAARYQRELADDPARAHAFDQLVELARGQPAVTLLTATRRVDRSAAAVLADRLCERLRASDGAPDDPSR